MKPRRRTSFDPAAIRNSENVLLRVLDCRSLFNATPGLLLAHGCHRAVGHFVGSCRKQTWHDSVHSLGSLSKLAWAGGTLRQSRPQNGAADDAAEAQILECGIGLGERALGIGNGVNSVLPGERNELTRLGE